MKELIEQVIAHKIAGNLGKADLQVTLQLIKHLRQQQQAQMENMAIANRIKEQGK